MSKENRVSDERLAELQHIVGTPAEGLYVSLPSTDISAALTELQSLRAKPVAGVEVKPLEWLDDGSGGFVATGSFGDYEINPVGFLDQEQWEILVPALHLGHYDTAEQAKAAAQADYRNRILSTLSLPAQEPAKPERDSPTVVIGYTNWRGEYGEREIVPMRPWFGSTEWHPEEQWLLKAWDVEKDAERDFALKDIGFKSPQPEAVITEEMVERAYSIIWPATEWNDGEHACREFVGAALTAALKGA